MAAPRAGRLLCVGVRGAAPGDATLERDLDACARAGVGAVLLFDVDVPRMQQLLEQGVDRDQAILRAPRNILGSDQLRDLIRHLKSRLGSDLLVCIDQEGGRVARISPRRGFSADPSASAFAALDPDGRRKAAAAQAQRLRELGFDLNFAPCVDLACEPDNPIIAKLDRAYGPDADAVIAAAGLVVQAHSDAGVASCLKHFPGHGSSRADTHLDTADVTASWTDAELKPYRELGSHPGVTVMVAHVRHTGIDSARPASISPHWVGGILRRDLGFEGVVVTDSIDMQALAMVRSPAEAAVAAIQAGCDLVIDAFNLQDRDEHPAPALAEALQTSLDGTRIEQSVARLDRLRAWIRHARGADA